MVLFLILLAMFLNLGANLYVLFLKIWAVLIDYFSLHNYFESTEQVVVAPTKQCVTFLPDQFADWNILMIHSVHASVVLTTHFTRNAMPFIETKIEAINHLLPCDGENVKVRAKTCSFWTIPYHNDFDKLVESSLQDSNNLILYIKRVCVGLLREPIQVLGAIVCFVDKSSRCTAFYGQQMARCFYSTCHCARQFWSINSTIFEQIQLYGKIKTALLDKNSAATADIFELAMCLTFENLFVYPLLNITDDCQF